MKNLKKLTIFLLVGIMLLSSMQLRTAEASGTVSGPLPLGRQWITGEELGSAIVKSPKERSTVGSNVLITPGEYYSYGSWGTHQFTLSTETGSYLGFCAEPNSSWPSGTFQVSKLNNDIIEGLILTYVIPELWNLIGVNFYTPGYEYVFCHAAIGYTYSGSLKGLSTQAANGIRAIVADITNIINGAGGYAGSQKTILLNSYLERYELHIAYNDKQDIVWAEEIPEVSTSLKLVKKQEGTEVAIPEVKFEHTNPDGTTESLTTDANGEITIPQLLYGKHSLREVTAPDGYMLNETIINFQVDRYGTVTIDSQAELPQQGILVDVTSQSITKKHISFTVYDKTVPYSLIIHKENQNRIKLAGAEFGLYLEAACINEFASGVTDEEGVLTFANLNMGITYYLKEKAAPLGYRLRVDEEGNPIVTEIRVLGIPAQDSFQLYTNGNEYDFNIGDEFVLTGTKASPEIHTTIINQVGYQLPQTGSSQMLSLAMAAIIVFSAGIFTKNNSKKGEKRI